jgi:hypothetical protein
VSRSILRVAFVLALASLAFVAPAAADDPPRFLVELEAGPTWQHRNDVQVPNDPNGTRFSMKEIAGSGPWFAGRVYFTWNIAPRHAVRLLAAPLSYTETASFDRPVSFAGADYAADTATDATYRFNSWRVGYRYRLSSNDRWRVWIGLTIKIRDARIELRQGDVSSFDSDVGIVPLLHFAANYRLADRWHLGLDFDGLAGGPGRAIDTALKVDYDLDDSWRLGAGYRLLEGGVEIDRVYNFAWFDYAFLSARVRF